MHIPFRYRVLILFLLTPAFWLTGLTFKSTSQLQDPWPAILLIVVGAYGLRCFIPIGALPKKYDAPGRGLLRWVAYLAGAWAPCLAILVMPRDMNPTVATALTLAAAVIGLEWGHRTLFRKQRLMYTG